MTSPTVLILDNGAYNIKAGIAGVDWEPRSVQLFAISSYLELMIECFPIQ